MNKAERVKLHSILTRMAENQESIIIRLDSLDASQKMIGQLFSETETDIKNILHVLEETQRQQRASTPDLRIVHEQKAPIPAE